MGEGEVPVGEGEGELGDEVGVLAGEVGSFRGIVEEVIEFGFGSVVFAEEFPGPVTDGEVGEVGVSIEVVAIGGAAEEEGLGVGR